MFKTDLTAAAFLLIGTLAIAQTPSAGPQKLPGKIKGGQITTPQPQSGNGSGVITHQSTSGDYKDSASTNAPSEYVSRGGRIKSHSNSTNNRQQNTDTGTSNGNTNRASSARIKSHSNSTNN